VIPDTPSQDGGQPAKARVFVTDSGSLVFDIGEAARCWASSGRPDRLLLRPPVLQDAEHWIATRPANAPAPTKDMQAYMAISRQAETRRRNVLTGSLAAGLVLALSLAAVAYWQRGIAVEQRKRAIEHHTLTDKPGAPARTGAQ
jgi:hypothetical protein